MVQQRKALGGKGRAERIYILLIVIHEDGVDPTTVPGAVTDTLIRRIVGRYLRDEMLLDFVLR